MFSPTAISYNDVLSGVTAQNAAAQNAEPEQDESPAFGMESESQTLRIGDSGSAVEEIQQRLNDMGYACDLTGVYDESTASAMRAFQAAVGVSQTARRPPRCASISSATPRRTTAFRCTIPRRATSR